MMLDDADFAALATEAGLAPSVHNTQPTRWRRDDEAAVRVLEDGSRRLRVGDPGGRDAGVSHGAAIEGFALAAAMRGWSISVEPLDGSAGDGLREVARLTLATDGVRDPLRAQVAARRTYRGRFRAGEPGPLAPLDAFDDVRVVANPEGVARLAALNDTAGLRTFRDVAFRAELLSWMRLSRRHPAWALDGLNREALAMSPVEAAGAGLVLRRGVFEALDRVGLAAKLTAEAEVVRSALAIVLFHRPEAEPPLLTGRRFYRLWLQFTALGLAAAPMTVLADDEAARAQVAHEFNIPSARRLITAFRVGVPSGSKPVTTNRPRLPTTQILV